MNIQQHLSAFDSWLTTRIEEAHARSRDLAFRDLVVDDPSGESPWEYSLLDPGARTPHGEGWSVYRLNGVWPAAEPEAPPQSQAGAAPARRSILDTIAEAVLKRGPERR